MRADQQNALTDVLADARDQTNIVRRRQIHQVPGGLMVVILAVDR